jgi:hypothetical protein
MPTARIISSYPERAANVAQFLRDNGFSVEIVSPLHAQNSPCDYEIDADALPDIVLEDPATYFVPEDEQVVEREFVLAPVWRAFRSSIAGFLAAIPRPSWKIPPKPQRVEATEVDPQPALRRRAVADRFAIGYARASEFGKRLELQNRASAARADLSRLGAAMAVRVREAISTIGKSAAVSLRHVTSATIKSVALRLRHVVSETIKSGAALQSSASRRSSKAAVSWLADRWLRPSFSIAAGMLLAFLLGFWAATGARTDRDMPSAVTTPKIEASVTPAVVVAPVPPAPASLPPVAATSKHREPVEVADDEYAEDDYADDEVIIRRYPNRGEVAQMPASPKKVKQFSDLDD